MRLWKAYTTQLLRSPLLWISILLTAFIASFHLIYQPMNTREVVMTFSYFIDVDAYRKLLPMFASFPFAMQFTKEWNSHIFDSVLYRSQFKNYVNTQVLVCVISSFLVCFLGMILFIVFASFSQPIYLGDYYPAPPYGNFLAQGKPILFMLIRAFMFSLSCAMWSICGRVVSALFPNTYVALCAPFICSYLVEHLTNRFPSYCRFYTMALGVQVISSESGAANFLYSILFYSFWIAVLSFIFRKIIEKRVQNELH